MAEVTVSSYGLPMPFSEEGIDVSAVESEPHYPKVHELIPHSEAGMVKRAFARFLTPKHPKIMEKVHYALGGAAVRKIVLGTAGRLFEPGSGGNYRLDHRKSLLESAHDFAYSRSVFNEAVHGTGFVFQSSLLGAQYLSSGEVRPLNVGLTLLEFSLINLQRYNRARMVSRMNEQLAKGEEFSPAFGNWTGIDHGAYIRYMADQA